MIRLPKLFKRKTQSDHLERGSVGMRRTPKKSTARSFVRAQENEEPALTEDPETQRARHRLIGASILVILAFIALPRILDSKPKAASNDIAVNIVTSLPVPGMNSETPANIKSNVASQVTPTTVAPVAPIPAPAPVPAQSNQAESKPDANKSAAQSQTPPTASAPDTKSSPPPVPAKSAALGLAAGEEVVASSNKPKTNADPTTTKPGANPAGKFVIQTEAFKSEDRLNGWLSKMKAQKIPSYVINKTTSDGTKLFVLRAGPFPDKDAAEAAEKKIKAMGLNSRIVDASKS
ncbi:SPOR domain-containing protein [Polynucleobacter paludilacus]|uniref:SPOR domain-containing protein n=1 Tax=Polynucleobacter paludilacus TaxID=1855895 RepID=UPI001BFD2467|nr:SPOR domain-containing protein [Polynucleobacter paludilacus]QWD87797.1 SPOR domain-containing protein [Polynucleobacter paludilacus]